MKISDAIAQDRPEMQAVTAGKMPVWPWERIGLGAVLLLSALLNFIGLDRSGTGNPYYAAAVKSMMMSWHNFFFVSFDPGGFVSVDKPPLGFWIQTISAELFGFNGWSLMLPQALAGVISVAVLYFLVRRSFGTVAGLVAALALALTPISVVASHNNTIDNLLVLAVLLGAWAVTLATEKGSLRWLLLCALCIGLAFNIKMLQAYLVVPAFGLMYLLGAPVRWRTRILHLFIALLVMLVISLAWVVTVDSIPASQRPYVGSSQTNSEFELAFGYNGLERLLGLGSRVPSGERTASTTSNEAPTGPLGIDETGGVGPLRLINEHLGGQASWLLPLAIVGLLFAAWQSIRASRGAGAVVPVEGHAAEWKEPEAKKRWFAFTLTRQQQALVMWGMWLVTVGIFFSVASFFHAYYLVTFAPAVAALAGIGIVALWREYVHTDLHGWSVWFLPATLLLTAGVQVYMLSFYPNWATWMTPLLLVLCIAASLVLIVARVMPHLRLPFALRPAIIVGMLALLIGPTIWSVVSIVHPLSSVLPMAGPMLNSGNSSGSVRPAGGAGFSQNNQLLEQYLLAHQGNATYLVAMTSASQAAPLILDTGKPVMALGGFLGSDPILTNGQLATLVKNGTVRYFLLQSFNMDELPPQIRKIVEEAINNDQAAVFGNVNVMISSWASTHCGIVPSSQWQSASTPSSGQGSPLGGGQDGSPVVIGQGGELPGGGQGGSPVGGQGGEPPVGGGQGIFPGSGGLVTQLYDCSSAH